MAICKFCALPFAWGRSEDGWIPLVPLGDEGTLDRAYQDENGDLRASHRLVCTNKGGPAVKIQKLVRPIKAHEIQPVHPKEEKTEETLYGPEIPNSDRASIRS